MHTPFTTLLALFFTSTTADWIDWNFTTNDWQVGFLNLTIVDLDQYRSTLTGDGALEFSVRRRTSPGVATCRWTGWAAATPPFGWKQCAPDLWFHFNMYAWSDVDMQMEIMEVNTRPNLTASMRTTAINLSTRAFDVGNRLICTTNWYKKHLGCSMGGPVFKSDVKIIQPDTTTFTMKPLIVQSIGGNSPPNCSVEIQLDDPNLDPFIQLNANATARADCRASWNCAFIVNTNITSIKKSLDCGTHTGWAADATLFLESAGGFSKATVSAVHTFHVTKQLVDLYARGSHEVDKASWIDVLVESRTSLRLGGLLEDDPNTNTTLIEFRECGMDDCQ